MNVNMDYKDALGGIIADVLRCNQIAEEEQQAVLKTAGDAIKKAVKDALPKSDEVHKHMRDDIKVTINGKKKKTGVTGVSVHGGKDTAYKWHMLDDGTRNPNGTVHTHATHFTSQAMQAATPAVEKAVDDLMRRITQA